MAPRLEKRRLEEPDAHLDFLDLGGIDEVALAGGTVRRLTYEPGWRWSVHVGPLLGVTVCQATHVGIVLQGRQGIETTDGQHVELAAGDVFCIPPGHDGWVIGEEPCVVVDFSAAPVAPAPGAWPSGAAQEP